MLLFLNKSGEGVRIGFSFARALSELCIEDRYKNLLEFGPYEGWLKIGPNY